MSVHSSQTGFFILNGSSEWEPVNDPLSDLDAIWHGALIDGTIVGRRWWQHGVVPLELDYGTSRQCFFEEDGSDHIDMQVPATVSVPPTHWLLKSRMILLRMRWLPADEKPSELVGLQTQKHKLGWTPMHRPG